MEHFDSIDNLVRWAVAEAVKETNDGINVIPVEDLSTHLYTGAAIRVSNHINSNETVDDSNIVTMSENIQNYIKECIKQTVRFTVI